MHPLVYELNTRCWLRHLSESRDAPVTLGDVPGSEFAQWEAWGITHVWLMGVWRTGPLARARAFASAEICAACGIALPGWGPEQLGASPYAVAGYEVEASLGGESGLRTFREQLHRAGLKLILDFVPNHLGLDHAWVSEAPERFVQSVVEMPGTFRSQSRGGDRWLAHGRDPYFPPWNDTVQLDYRLPATRQAMAGVLASVANLCDGVRCDMAMLLLPEVFEKTWREIPPVAGAAPGDFWPEAISKVRDSHPEFLFLAEAYWGLGERLLDAGFDFAYDKVLLDRIVERNPPAVVNHVLEMKPRNLAGGAHFLENHDEPRIAGRLTFEELRPALLLILALPGMRFLHEGQIEGCKHRVPVQLLGRNQEIPDPAICEWHTKLLTLLPDTAIGKGTWEVRRLCAINDAAPASGSPAAELPDVLVIQWRDDGRIDLAAVNLASRTRAGSITLEKSVPDAICEVRQLVGQHVSVSLAQHGSAVTLNLSLPPWTAVILRLSSSAAQTAGP